MSRSLRTLYFVSDGHVGLGFGDVYMVERTDLTDWTSWNDPINLGREVNSGFREGGLSLSADERRLYLSSDFGGHAAAYSFATAHNTASAGQTYSLDVTELERSLVRLQVADVDQQTVTQVVDYQGDGSAVDLNLLNNRRYALLADAGTSFVTATVVNPADLGRYRLPAYTYEQLVAMDRPLPLPVVDFSADGAELLPVAQLQLEQLARFLTQHPEAVAEVIVDVVGADARHCYTLSLQRADAVRAFLAAHGVAAVRILLSPYGSARAGLGGTSAVSVRFREGK
jgi:outer membrane protein OmpA-like peptidoglycan-associated protein